MFFIDAENRRRSWFVIFFLRFLGIFASLFELCGTHFALDYTTRSPIFFWGEVWVTDGI